MPNDTQMMVVRGPPLRAPGRGRILTGKPGFSDPVAIALAWNARSRTAVMPRGVGAGADGLVRRGR